MTKEEWINAASCLDAAYERVAITQGLMHPKDAVFPENKYHVPYFTSPGIPGVSLHRIGTGNKD